MAAKPNYRRLPTWLCAPNGRAWVDGTQAVKLGLLARAKDAVKARFPDFASGAGLDAIGRDRGIERAPGESDEAYRPRLKAWLQTWRWAGTRRGLLTALAAAGLSNVRIYERWDLAAAGILPPVEGELRNRFYVVVAQPHGWTFRRWDSGWVYDAPPGATLDSDDATVNDVERIRRIVRMWRPAHAICAGVIVSEGTSTELTSYDPDSRTFTLADGAHSVVWHIE